MSTKIKNIIARDEQYQMNCVRKWQKLLNAKSAAPIKDSHVYRTTAVLLENQSRTLKEAANTSSIWGGSTGLAGGAVGNTDGYAPGDNRLPKTILPMIRRTVPELITNEIAGVQPMSVPVSLAFAIRFRYDNGPLHEARSAGTLTNPGVEGPHYGVGTSREGVDMTQMVATTGAEMGYNYLDSSFTGRRNPLFNRVINPATGIPFTDAEVIKYVNDTAA